MKKFTTLFIGLFLIASCIIHKQKPNKTFINILNDETHDENIILVNGIYSMISNNSIPFKKDSIESLKKNIFKDPLVFFNNGLVTWFSQDSQIPDLEFVKVIKNMNSNKWDYGWGVYMVTDNYIKSIIYYVFEGRGGIPSSWKLCYFEGELVNKVKILNWHLVPPYPEFSNMESINKSNYSLLGYLKTPKDYEFKEFPEKTLIDSNAVWINKYRKKKK